MPYPGELAYMMQEGSFFLSIPAVRCLQMQKLPVKKDSV